MNYIVLVKQVPDIKNIPNEAWDWEKGTLKRGLLDNVCNDLDKQALAFAVKLREEKDGKIVALTMGPPFADEVLRYGLSVGADKGVLLTDRKLGGADTAATAYPLAQTIKKIQQEIFGGERDYIIISGMQSVDGDTAQVPAQVAEDLNIAHIAYATSGSFENGVLTISRITHSGTQTVSPLDYPCLVTVSSWTEPLYGSFSRTRWAKLQEMTVWSAADVGADDSRVGLTGSRTTVFRIFSPRDVSTKTCVMVDDVAQLVKAIKETYDTKLNSDKEEDTGPEYHLPEGKEPSYHGDVWIYAEQEGGELNPASYELLGKAADIARSLEVKACAVLVGKGVKKEAAELIRYGADKVYLAEHELLDHFLPVPYTKVVSELIDTYKPQIMLFSATPLGRELAPRVASRAESGLTADCTALDIMDYQRGKQEWTAILRQTRPALGGNIMASIITQNSKVQMSTVRPGVMKALPADDTRKGEIIEYAAAISEKDLGAKILSKEPAPLTSDIKEAGVIVSGGAGCRTKENYESCIIPLAEKLGGYLGVEGMAGASRAAVEHGFNDRSHQVGQTGQTVKPRVYVAVGISGAVQHITGMQNSDIIVAINRDPKAPIFKVCDFGVVGDMDTVVPELIKALDSSGK